MAELKLKWTPEPADFPADDVDALILSQEGETNITARVVVEREDEDEETQEPHSVRWDAPQGLPPHMLITAHNGQEAPYLEITVADWVGLFPMEINYMADVNFGTGINQTPHMVDEWEDVPATTADVYAYHPSQQNVYRLPLVVYALASNNASEPDGEFIEQVTYTITVYSNYDIGKDALKAAVAARNDATGG
jgi:hypothetical protein